MNKQKGLSLSSFLLWGIVVAITAMIAMGIVPSFVEYTTIKGIANRLTHESQNYSNITAVRAAFDKQADIDQVKTLTANDLKISKEGAVIVIEFEYDKRVKLVGNVSLLINYHWKTH